MVKKWPPLYQKMLSFTYCKQPLLYHRKFSLTQLSGCSYIIGSSPLTQCRQPLLCKRVLSPKYECSRIYIKGHSLYLLWAAAPISILNNEGGRPFTSAHFQKVAMSGFIIQKGVMAKWFLLSQRNMWLEGLGLWMLLFNLTRWDGVHLEDEVDIRLVYGWNWYCRVICCWYSINQCRR